MSFTMRELADLVDGQLHGDPQLVITGADIIRDVGETEITLADASFEDMLADCPAAAIVTCGDYKTSDRPCIVVENLHVSFGKIVARFRRPRRRREPFISPTAHICPSAKLGRGVTVRTGVYIGEDVEIADDVVLHTGVQLMDACRIGAGTQLFPNVIIYEHTVIGERVVLHAGVVIGAYGFGYESTTGKHALSPQLGHVEIENDVHIGANSTVDRATYGVTLIGEGTKIDNLVMIGHNCRIGKHNLICAQVGIAGSATTGDYVVMAGQVGVRDHVHVGDRGVLGAKAGAGRDVPADATYFGVPAIPEREHIQWYMAGRRVPRLIKKLDEMKKRVDELSRAAEDKSDAA